MRPGMGVFSAGELSSAVGIVLGGLSYRFGGVMSTFMCSVTGCVGRAAPPAPFPRTHWISAREVDIQLIERKGVLKKKRTALRG